MTDPPQKRKVAKYLFVVIGALVLAGFIVVAKRYYDIDRCLDRGGGWNEELDQCEME